MIEFFFKINKIALLIVLPLFIACQDTKKKISILKHNPDLKKTDEGWLYKDMPFTGFMIEEEKHRVVHRLPIINGQEQGLARAWYHTGEKLLERNFVDSKIEGEFRQWWPNGNLRYLFHYKNDVFEGIQYVYFPSGNKREESNFRAGEQEGIQRVWDESNDLVSNYTIKNKKTYGVISVKSCIPVGH